MFDLANWIEPSESVNVPVFKKEFTINKKCLGAELTITSRGVYIAFLNGKRIGDFIMAPGWTSHKRIQVQQYNISDFLEENNVFEVYLAKGWNSDDTLRVYANQYKKNIGFIAEITLNHIGGEKEVIATDSTFTWARSGFSYCGLYSGFKFDANISPEYKNNAIISKDNSKDNLVLQQGKKVCTQERLKPLSLIITPKGEKVLDFGQNMTGWLEIDVNGKKGDLLSFSFGEILDFSGNFYNENYRDAKCSYEYICKDGFQHFKPELTFYGFRYVRIESYPYEIDLNNFTATVIHSDLKRTGYIKTSDSLVNRLYENVIWGQKSNYLDVPTDCPQRDERLGWTGDAQVFVRTAAYNYDVRKFFKKWLTDMKFDQSDDGKIPSTVPDSGVGLPASAAWSDAVTVCPWQLYQTYGDKYFLELMFEPMKKWVDYVTASTTHRGLWIGGQHFGDWLELKCKYGEYKGDTRDDFVASAFYAYSTKILIETGKVLEKDVKEYEELYKEEVSAFKENFGNNLNTQTEYLLALQFDLCDEPEKKAKELVELIHSDGDKLQTGFVGTPYFLPVLTKFGYSDLAYKVFLRKEFPSWLYPVTKGATTMWEHWDGIRPDGTIWSSDMNSFNHYAYGAVGEWMYSSCGGINPLKPGYEELLYTPVATKELDCFEVEFNSLRGKIVSKWYHKGNKTVYELITPVKTKAIIAGKEYSLNPGTYVFD